MVRLIVLGLLRMKPLSGYEIQQILQTSQTDLWAGILPGSIYHALKKMDKEGLIAVDNLEKTGHRIKAIYKITELGEVEFYQLLKSSLREKSVHLPSTLYSGLSFIHELPLDEKLEALQNQKSMLENELEILKIGQETKEAHVKLDELLIMQFDNMYAHYELQIDFLQKLIIHLETKNTASDCHQEQQ